MSPSGRSEWHHFTRCSSERRSSSTPGQTPKLSPALAATRWLSPRAAHRSLLPPRDDRDDSRLHQPSLERAEQPRGRRGVNIRSASFRDLARIEQLLPGRARDRRERARGPDGPRQPGSRRNIAAPLVRAHQDTVVAGPDHRRRRGDLRRGGYQGRRGRLRAGASAGSRPSLWQILNFCISTPAHGHFARAELLDAPLQPRSRARRPPLPRAPAARPSTGRVFLEHGYAQFATEQILYPGPGDSRALNRGEIHCRSVPRAAMTSAAIYLLYRASRHPRLRRSRVRR